MTKIMLAKLIPNQDLQTRTKLDENNVERLRIAFKNKVKLPAILVKKIKGSDKYEIYDGFHRYEAAKIEGIEHLDAELFKGSSHEALTEGVTRNMQHGLQLIREDMKKAAKMLYTNPGSANKSKREKGSFIIGSSGWVGQILGVHSGTVSKWTNPTSIERENNRNKHAHVSAKLVKETGEEGLKEKVLEIYGVDALGQNYNPSVEWSINHPTESAGVPVLCLSDIHYAEVVDPEQIFNSNTFNINICKQRIKYTVETAVGLVKSLPKPDYPGFVLLLVGDNISGSIHDELSFSDEVRPIQQATEIAEILADSICFLADEFPKVDVYCVPGNHGRTTRKPWAKFYAHNNLDCLVYHEIGLHTKGLENVTINAPAARDYTINVAGHRYRLTHGDQFRGGNGYAGAIVPIIHGDNKKTVSAAKMPGQPEIYDTLVCGHFHQLIMLPRLIVNGSIKGYDEYAHSINVPWEPPQQALWMVHRKHGHTFYMPVLCDPEYSAHGINMQAA